jgi:15-cis-phytoene synthase
MSEKDIKPAVRQDKDAWKITENVIRSQSKTFFLATGLLPTRQRKAIRALYAFCRASDDLVDSGHATLQQIADWRAEVDRSPEQQTNPLLYCWAVTRQEYDINRRYEKELIDGVQMDLQFKPYATWQELEKYCYLVASTVGLLSMPVLGLAPGISFEQAAQHGIILGIALQLTNILRDVGEDAAHGRVYLPAADLALFGLSTDDIYHQVFDGRFIGLMQYEIARARSLYRKAMPGIAMLSASGRPSVGAAALLYAAILDEIEANGFQVYTKRAHTSGLRKLSLLPGIFLQVFSLPRHGQLLESKQF